MTFIQENLIDRTSRIELQDEKENEKPIEVIDSDSDVAPSVSKAQKKNRKRKASQQGSDKIKKKRTSKSPKKVGASSTSSNQSIMSFFSPSKK